MIHTVGLDNLFLFYICIQIFPFSQIWLPIVPHLVQLPILDTAHATPFSAIQVELMFCWGKHVSVFFLIPLL